MSGAAPRGAGTERELARPGSVRHSLIELAVPAVLAEVLFALVGGWPGAGAGAALLAVTGLLVARRVAGAGAEGFSLRRRPRQMDVYEHGLGDWRWTVRQGLDPQGDSAPLRARLQRLYAVRLAEVHGVNLPADRDRAAELVGPRLWPWIDPLSPMPAGVFPVEVLRELVDRLDSL
ncbi:hypothetical protein [Streptomyces sp. CBMA123]|uniref:hypothetical protein n=1 Tax=Streptomyces sp. CBMA123 TaxID=1896313 RepID=UPI001662086E|nr:hypothetical protein [Streptomyces sp. CBMA123]MBD0689148.1 hypothetical protein [Streptomyces sp. CBMA123]